MVLFKLICAVFITFFINIAQAQVPADEVLKSANGFVNFPSSITKMRMQVVRKGKVESEYLMNVKKLDSERMRIEFSLPIREKGRRILRVGGKMWMFLPDLGKPIVISARQSFLGSSFSNGDLLRTDLVLDYSASLLREEMLSGVAVQVLELKAKSVDVAYDRVLLWVDKTNKRPIRQEFFTLSGKRIKVMTLSSPLSFGKTTANSIMKVESDLNKDEYTVLTIVELSVNQKLPAALFQKDSFDR
jgi:outer membrane lipoprotein-sorting protein